MLLRFKDGDVEVTAQFGSRMILAYGREIDAFRARTDAADDLVTALPLFLTRAVLAGDVPATLLMHRSGTLCGVVLLRFRRKFGVPSGVVSAGNATGGGSVIASSADRIAVMETAARTLMKIPLVHTALLTTIWPETACPGELRFAANGAGCWHFREVGIRLDLSGGSKHTMERLGYKMRRNLGYYRRRAEARFGCRAVPELPPEQRVQAVQALSGQGTYRMSLRDALTLDAMLLAMPGSFAMGLQGAEGEWLSYIAGWRTCDGTYVEWQLNREEPVNASMSTVTRSYLLEQELERQSLAITFVGGTAPIWSKACVPAVCGDLLVVRKGLIGGLSRHLARRFSPSGQLAQLQAKTAS